TSTSRPATAAPPWTPTPSRSRPGPACAASRDASRTSSRAAAPRSPASSRAPASRTCSSPTIRASRAPARSSPTCRTGSGAMLPEPLSAHMCSLVPEEDRLAMVVRIDLDRHADVVERDFCAAVIHSRARLDYPGVAAALAGDTRGKRKKYEALLPLLRLMDSL